MQAVDGPNPRPFGMRRVKIFNKKEDAKNARGREMGGFLSSKNRCILPVAEDRTAFLRLNFRGGSHV
jgi:hypothetical protein